MYLEIREPKVLIHTTEQTIKEMYNEIMKFKEKNPEADVVRITSQYSVINFEIHLETKPHTQESLGFRVQTKITAGGNNEKDLTKDR
jgi:hypothetical protein